MKNQVMIGFLALSILIIGVIVYFVVQSYNSFADEATVPLTDDFGVVTFVSSLPARTNKLAVIDKATKAGFTWAREEFTYTDPMNYVPFDSAYNKITEKSNLKILGLLTYPGPEKSHDVWKNYVTEVVARYPKVSAWEIMNEVDNHIAAAEYTVYLEEAYAIIKSRSSVPVICTGLTARPEAYQFWDGIVAAGGWTYCDGLGLHPYHDGSPLIEDTNGTLATEIQEAVDDIKKNNGDPSTTLGTGPANLKATTLGTSKKIWVTEFGYDSLVVGEESQAKWLVEGMEVLHSFPEVEKIFAFRLYEHDNGYGLVNVNFAEKPAFTTVKNWLASVAALRPTAVFSPERSSIRIEGTTVAADGTAQFEIFVSLKDKNGEPLSEPKPNITITGGPTTLTDFELQNNEWVVKVASTEKGQKNAEIKVKEKVLGTAVMFFSQTAGQSDYQTPPINVSEASPANVISDHQPVVTMAPSTATAQTVQASLQESDKLSATKAGLAWFIVIEATIAILIIIVIMFLGGALGKYGSKIKI